MTSVEEGPRGPAGERAEPTGRTAHVERAGHFAPTRGSGNPDGAVYLDARPAGAAEARDLTAACLARHGGRVPGPVLDDVLLVVSELVTNALRHAGGVTGLRVALRRGSVEVTVQDGSGSYPVSRRQDGNWLPGGHGWPMVSRLAEVAVERFGAGKLVCARVPLGEA